jgi:uncharacterized tellurite resistance protein B-like protein
MNAVPKNLADLTRDEQLALGGLIRQMIRADGVFSAEEEERVDAIGEELGSKDLIWRMISDSAQAFKDDAEVRRAAAAISRVGARELVLGVLTSVAIADTVSPGEMGLLDALRAAWGIVDRGDDAPEEGGNE